MNPPIAVIDTNVLVSGLLTNRAEAPTSRILDGMTQGGFPFLLSLPLLTEYRRVLLRPPIASRHRLAPGELDVILEAIVVHAILREPAQSNIPAPDGNDQHLWDLLATHASATLVTGDRRLLDEPPPLARVISPASFIALLET